MNNHEVMIISALRYALPRRSYIMAVTEEYILNMLRDKNVSKNFIEVAIKDIEEYMEQNPYKDEVLGGHDWSNLLEVLIKNK